MDIQQDQTMSASNSARGRRDDVRIRIAAQRCQTLTNGELIIEPYSNWYAKDFLVGASIVAYARPFVMRQSQAGFGFLLVGMAGFWLERVRLGFKGPSSLSAIFAALGGVIGIIADEQS